MSSNADRFSELKNQVLNKTIDPEDFLKRIWDFSAETKRKGRVYRGTKEKPVQLYRARVVTELPTGVQELSYPPLEKTELGRANKAGEQIFYASAGFPTNFVELKNKIKINSMVVVSEWQCYCDIYLQEVGFIPSQNNETIYENLLKIIFTQTNEEFYKYTSVISKHLMNCNQIAGIIYPSIESKNQSENVALKKEFVDKNLFCVNATVYLVKNILPDFKFEINEINFATNNETKLLWKGRGKNWVIRENGGELKMISYNSLWHAYNKESRLIHPE